MYASLIIPFCENRLDNVEQTLRFFKKEDITKDSELILICQGSCNLQINGFKYTTLVQLHSKEYCRAKMCNLGVAQSQSEIIILLDSDRILADKYFTKVCSSINPSQCVTTKNLWQITHAATDEEIISGNYGVYPDHRSTSNEMHKKGMFSGNTVMFKTDYLDIGGMDESFVGYGYQDIDFEKTAINKGMEMVFLDDKELHLHHPKIPPEEVRSSTVKNGIKYCRKWGLTPEPLLIERGNLSGIDVAKEVKRKVITFL